MHPYCSAAARIRCFVLLRAGGVWCRERGRVVPRAGGVCCSQLAAPDSIASLSSIALALPAAEKMRRRSSCPATPYRLNADDWCFVSNDVSFARKQSTSSSTITGVRAGLSAWRPRRSESVQSRREESAW